MIIHIWKWILLLDVLILRECSIIVDVLEYGLHEADAYEIGDEEGLPDKGLHLIPIISLFEVFVLVVDELLQQLLLQDLVVKFSYVLKLLL